MSSIMGGGGELVPGSKVGVRGEVRSMVWGGGQEVRSRSMVRGNGSDPDPC